MFQDFLLHRDENKFYINSGDEYAYEYVTDEQSYYIDTQYQKGMLVLPPKPKDKFKIIVLDYFRSWLYYPLIIHRNGNKIMGIDENMVCDVPNMIFSLIYTNTNMGWVVSQDLNTNKNKEKL